MWYLNEGHVQGRLPRSAHPALTPCALYQDQGRLDLPDVQQGKVLARTYVKRSGTRNGPADPRF